MIEIKKGKEPSELARYRNLKDATYRNLHGAPSGRVDADGRRIDVYTIVLNSLIREQGQLCAYCMKRIPERKGRISATIEHIEPQSRTDESMRLDYRNMLAVCSGNRNGADHEKTCDARRGSLPQDRQTLYVNPLKKDTLKTIVYHSNGVISSEDSKIDQNLNDTLNLNCGYIDLPGLRKAALTAMQQEIHKKYPGRTAPKDYFVKLRRKIASENVSKRPYVGILIQWLDHKIQRL